MGPVEFPTTDGKIRDHRTILLVTNDLGPRAGGIETFILGLLSQLDGSDVVVYTSAQEESASFDAALNSQTGVVVIRDRATVLLPSFRVKREVTKVMKRYGCSTIWFGAAMPLAWISGYLKKHGAARIVALTHGHEVWWAKIPIFSWIFRSSTQNIDVLTYLGDFTRRSIIPIVSPNCSLVQIAPGIPLDHFFPAPKNDDLVKTLQLDGRQVLLSVGRLVHRKGQDRLIEALPTVVRANPNVVLVIVGIGPRQRKLDQLISQHGMKEYVRFVGRVNYSELPHYFRLADLFVMPSRSRFGGLEVEGLGIVYLEASASGVPVLAGLSGGAPDAVVVGMTGVLVDGRKSKGIAQAINALLADPTALRAMGARGRQWTEEVWGWSTWGERFKSVLVDN
jgi:phosphatidylinositol alpha-1,6-mannosyltransferase